MAKPLPCWGRERDPVPIDENPLLQWVKRRREGEPEHANRAAPCDMGRGRLMTNGPSTSSPDVSSSDGMGYASAYWRNQRGPIEPGLDISESMHPVGPSTASEQLSGGRPRFVADLGSSLPSGLEHHVPSAAVPEMDPEMAAADPQSPSDPQARQGISRSWKVRHEELRRRNAEPWRSPPMSTLHGQPRVSQSQPRQRPSHVGDGTNKTAAGPDELTPSVGVVAEQQERARPLPANWAVAVGTVERPLLGGRPRHLCGKVDGHPGGGLHLIHQISCSDST